MTDDEFLTAFEDTTLPREAWTHTAHLRLAYLYLRRSHTIDEALATIRSGIQAYNLSKGNPRGYHETITVAFARLVADALRQEAFPEFPAMQSARPDLFRSDVLLRYYSRGKLYSPEARAVFVEPDGVEALP